MKNSLVIQRYCDEALTRCYSSFIFFYNKNFLPQIGEQNFVIGYQLNCYFKHLKPSFSPLYPCDQVVMIT